MPKVQTQSEWELQVSHKVLEFIRHELYLDMRFFDVALSELMPMPDDSIDTMATDGQILHFNQEQLLRVFKQNSKFLDRLYLHMVLHCIFSHLWIRGNRQRAIWDIACDIIVEYTIDSMDKSSVKRPVSWLRSQVYGEIERANESVSAAVLYRKIITYDTGRLQELQAEFYTDSHRYWPKEQKMSASQNNTRNKWDKISRQTEMKRQSSGDESDKGSNFWQTQVKAEKGKRDYGEFLRKFAVLKEELHCDPDEFDMSSYTYGLSLYGNMPLIEPVETREIMKIQEFVVVIDTSYSTSGDLVKNFLKETFSILSEKNSFFRSCKLHVIQCDDTVKSDIVITEQTNIDALLHDFEVSGGGNTDFRPAFEYVNELISSRQIERLRGLLYFTDGKGTYPRKKPPYQTAFLYVDEFDESAVPPWAIRMRLEPEMLDRTHCIHKFDR